MLTNSGGRSQTCHAIPRRPPAATRVRCRRLDPPNRTRQRRCCDRPRPADTGCLWPESRTHRPGCTMLARTTAARSSTPPLQIHGTRSSLTAPSSCGTIGQAAAKRMHATGPTMRWHSGHTNRSTSSHIEPSRSHGCPMPCARTCSVPFGFASSMTSLAEELLRCILPKTSATSKPALIGRLSPSSPGMLPPAGSSQSVPRRNPSDEQR
mmetsp:Transcript_11234/g.39840  ORF Transcript_11234/g.39840 Transcript_11234/m.39840 type:complete len:209 (-) Transcript_11234:1237-1863(-)